MDELPTLGLLGSVAILGFGVVLTTGYDIAIVNFWYRLMYMSCVLFQVEFEGRLSVSFLGYKAILSEKLTLETTKFLKVEIETPKSALSVTLYPCSPFLHSFFPF